VARINTGRDYTPGELMELKENDYETLTQALTSAQKTGKQGGFSKLARLLGKAQSTIYPQTMLVFLGSELLGRLESDPDIKHGLWRGGAPGVTPIKLLL